MNVILMKHIFKLPSALLFQVNGHYIFEGQSNFENFLRAYGITDEKKITQLAESKPELFMEKVGPNVTVTFVVSPTFNSTFSFIEGEEYEADFFGVGKNFKVIREILESPTSLKLRSGKFFLDHFIVPRWEFRHEQRDR